MEANEPIRKKSVRSATRVPLQETRKKKTLKLTLHHERKSENLLYQKNYGQTKKQNETKKHTPYISVSTRTRPGDLHDCRVRALDMTTQPALTAGVLPGD